MEEKDIIEIISNNLSTAGLLIYFIYRDFKFMRSLTDSLTEIKTYITIQLKGGNKK